VPTSVAQRVCAVRRLAVALSSDVLVQCVRCPQAQRDRPHALSDLELAHLSGSPDRRTRIGIRGRAVLELLARAGLSVPSSPGSSWLTSGSAAASRMRGGAQRSRRRGEQTQLEVVVRGSKPGRTRTVPLHAEALEVLRRWYASRPAAATEALFVSLLQRRSAPAEALSPGAVGEIVAKHAAAAGVREDRRTAHALRHTFCTMLAERDVALEVISELAGHADVRTTQLYVAVSEQRKAAGIAALERARHPLAAA
jgi:site-specific recombinase XerD